MIFIIRASSDVSMPRMASRPSILSSPVPRLVASPNLQPSRGCHLRRHLLMHSAANQANMRLHYFCWRSELIPQAVPHYNIRENRQAGSSWTHQHSHLSRPARHTHGCSYRRHQQSASFSCWYELACGCSCGQYCSQGRQQQPAAQVGIFRRGGCGSASTTTAWQGRKRAPAAPDNGACTHCRVERPQSC
jgi:hypothetical protein